MTQNLKDLPKQTLHDAEPARAVFDDQGRVLFATESFAALCRSMAADLKGRRLTDILSFDEPDNAFHATRLFGRTSGSDLQTLIESLREGAHPVSLDGHKTEIQFDRVRIQDGQSFLIASAGNESAPPDDVFLTRVKNLRRDYARAPAKDARPDANDDGFRHCIEMSFDLLSVCDASGNFSHVNPTFHRILGYSDLELAAMSFMDIIHPDDKSHVRNTLSCLMHDDAQHDEIADFEARLVAQDNSIRWTEWRHKRKDDLIYSVGRDVTDFRKSEENLYQQQVMLREAQSIGRMGHWRWLVGSNDIQWSDEIYKIFGVRRDNFIPALDAVNRMTHKRDVGRLLQAFQRAIIEENDYDMEFRITRPDGEVRYIRCEGRCEHDKNEEVVALFGIMQDVTERTLYERNLTEAKDAAERAYAAKSQFLANMSHELRTPLNAIIGFSEMMQRQLLGPIGSDRYLDYIAGIRESGEHLLDLISDILDMSKIEAGKYELDLEELNVAKIIRLAVHMMEGRATDAKIRVAIDVLNEDLHIVADRRALMQVLLNLLSNAVKFTEPGGSVRVECIKRKDFVSIKVHDTGIGIPANQLKDITRPFEQAASHYTRKHEGTGLGLAITKELVEMHGGSLHIDSTVGVGTVVTVRIPYNAYDAMKKKDDPSRNENDV